MTEVLPSFEEALKQLEETVERLESGDLSLEESLGLFEQGVANVKRCQEVLGAAENQIEILLQGKDGRLRSEPFEANDDD